MSRSDKIWLTVTFTVVLLVITVTSFHAGYIHGLDVSNQKILKVDKQEPTHSLPPEPTPPLAYQFLDGSLAVLDAVHEVTPEELDTKSLKPTEKVFVERVLDGDTFAASHFEDDQKILKIYRLHWGDTPEISHNSKEKDEPLGPEAKAFTTTLIKGKLVTVTIQSTSYGRSVVDAKLKDGKDLAEQLTVNGLAVLDERFNPPKQLSDMQMEARKNRVGVWKSSVSPTPPWVWRHDKLGKLP